MGVPVDELKGRVSAPQLALYKAVALIDGPWWGTEAEACYSADICHTLACIHSSADKRPDWVARTWETKPQPEATPMTGSQAAAFMMSLVPPHKRPRAD